MASNRQGRELFRTLAAGRLPAPIVLAYGDETFFVDEAIAAVRRAALGADGDEFSHQVFEGGATPGERVRQVLENLPLFGGQRLIHVRGVDAMSADELAALEPYLNNPAPQTTLLMTGRSVDLRKRFFKAVKASPNAVLVAFKPLYANELPGWIVKRANKKGLSGLSREMAEVVAELTGPDLSSMDSALDKLSLYTAGAALQSRDIRAVLDDTRSRSVFELTALLGGRDLPRALQALHRLLEGGDSPVGLVAMVARHFRIVLRVKSGLADGLRGSELARAAGCPPMFLSEYRQDAERFDPVRLNDIVGAIHDADRALKSSGLADRIVMDRLVFDIALPTAVA